MWSDGALTEDQGLLRQGDLIVGVAYPIIEHPYRFVGAEGGQIARGDDLVIRAGVRDLLVTSQCCEIENTDWISLAPILNVNIKNPEALAPYLRDEPRSGEPYVYSAMKLDINGHLVAKDRKIYVADFSQIFSVKTAEPSLRTKRIARMTPEGRLTLRTKLGHYWSRAEESDKLALGLATSSLDTSPA